MNRTRVVPIGAKIDKKCIKYLKSANKNVKYSIKKSMQYNSIYAHYSENNII